MPKFKAGDRVVWQFAGLRHTGTVRKVNVDGNEGLYVVYFDERRPSYVHNGDNPSFALEPDLELLLDFGSTHPRARDARTQTGPGEWHVVERSDWRSEFPHLLVGSYGQRADAEADAISRNQRQQAIDARPDPAGVRQGRKIWYVVVSDGELQAMRRRGDLP